MRNIDIYYSEERGNYEMIVDGEWYAEGTYECLNQMAENIKQCEIEEETKYLLDDINY